MKRSEINAIIRDAESFFAEMRFALPPFASWTADDWRTKGEECAEIADNSLGWDITDFGSGDFSRVGLLLITIRNGSLDNPLYPKPYAEKIMIVGENQVTPTHFHWSKQEDIINRGGGELAVRLYNSDENEALSDTDVVVSLDGVKTTLKAGSLIYLKPGESITMTRGLYHSFWGREGCGKVLVGEVSKTNDDNTDNRFLESTGRFPAIDEDEPPYRLLCNEYRKYMKK